MSWDRVEGNRKKLKGSIRQLGGKLSDEQLELMAVKHGQLPEKVQAMYGIVDDDDSSDISNEPSSAVGTFQK